MTEVDQKQLYSEPDAQVWAQEFMKVVQGGAEIDEGLVAGWFANAFYTQESKDSRAKHEIDVARIVNDERFSFTIREGEALTLREAVFQALGCASICWDPKPEGVFDSEYAVHVGEQLLTFLQYHYTEVKRVTSWADGDLPEVGSLQTFDDEALRLPKNYVVIEVYPAHREVVLVALPIEPVV